MFVKEALFRAIVQALGFKKNQRTVGLEQVIDRVADNFIFAGVIGFRCETERLKKWFEKKLFGRFFRFLFIETVTFQPLALRNQSFEPGKKFFFHRLRMIYERSFT